MLNFSPLAQGDFTGWNVVVDADYRSEEIIYQHHRKNYPAEWGDKAPEGSSASVDFIIQCLCGPCWYLGIRISFYMS